jgi:hypothetical protein
VRSVIAVVIFWLLLANACLAQNCVITSSTIYGTVQQHCIVIGPTKLTFQSTIAEELVSKLPAGKLIRLEASALRTIKQ